MRKTILTAAATAALLAFGAASANAECASGTAGISKDGSLAPLQQPAAGSADAGSTGTTTGSAAESQAQPSGAIAKDGATMPLASEPGGGSDIATSPQDVQRQQDGQPTAAAGAAGATSPSSSC
jgi:hypothetical protein